MLKSQLEQQSKAVDTIVSNMRVLETKLAEAKMKKDTLKARAQSAKSARAITDMVAGLNTGSALSAFEKMEDKVLAMESEAEAATMVRDKQAKGWYIVAPLWFLCLGKHAQQQTAI
jgi:phage shock protein A